MTNAEKKFLNKVSRTYDRSGYTDLKRELIVETYFNFLRCPGKKMLNKKGLEMGCSDGFETRLLAKKLKELDVVDGSSAFIKGVKRKNKCANVNFIYSLFENYSLKPGVEKYDHIFCDYVLEHVNKPVTVLKNIKKLLKKNGLMFIAVPNENALSRQLAVRMGILRKLKDLTPNDKDHGHRRTYNRATFDADIKKAGLSIKHSGGVIFKILADFQMEELMKKKILKKEHIRALNSLSSEYPEFSDTIYSICGVKR